jgi:hypothetical protein
VPEFVQEAFVSSGLSITGTGSLQPVSDVRLAPTSQTSNSSTQTATAAATAPPLNPRLHIDASLGLVVLQFLDTSGNVTQSIPSAKQIAAYRQEAEQPHLPGSTSDTETISVSS